MPPVAVPLSDRETQVADIWRGNGRLASTIRVYLSWVRRFERDHPEGTDLTCAVVEAFANRYAHERGVGLAGTIASARIALRAWSRGLRRGGVPVPEWAPPPVAPEVRPLLADYREFRSHHAGVAASTVASDLRLLSEFLDAVVPGHSGTSELSLTLKQIDDYVTTARSRWSRRTTARFCTALRSFLRFVHHRGYAAHDLARSVAAPVVRLGERPPRALPWADVQRLLGAVDVSCRTGRRDYALLLTMASYGMGAAEALHLCLEDFDWRAGTIRVFRPKTHVEYLLPLLPAVAQALLDYFRDGRPAKAASRHVFVAAVEPHGPMSSSAVRHAIRTHAAVAGLTGTPLGGHSLRHSHARRQVELGAPLKTVGDILGHRDPSSTSAYVRIATSRLRSVALPVPRR